MYYKTLKIRKKQVEEDDEMIEVDESRLVSREELLNEKHHPILVCERVTGDFQGKAYYLNSGYDWVIGEDEPGMLCLIPLKKRY